jgi:hypothetical protein
MSHKKGIVAPTSSFDQQANLNKGKMQGNGLQEGHCGPYQ